MDILQPTAFYSVAAIAFGISVFSQLVHTKLVDRSKMDAIRQKIEAHQKEYLKAQKANDKAKMTKLEKEQADILGLVKENMMSSFKPMFITMPIILIVLWFMNTNYSALDPLVNLSFGIPLLTYAIPEAGLSNAIGWFGIYVLIAILTSLFIELIVKRILKVIKK